MVKQRSHLALAALLCCVTSVSLPIGVASAAPDAGAVTVPAMVDASSDPAPSSPSTTVDAAVPTQPPVITPSSDAPPTPAPTVTVDSEDGTLAQTLWKAIQSKDWFLAVGAALALLIHGVRWLLKKKWAKFEQDRWGWFLAAGLAGAVALATAWLAGKDAASSHTLVGALKILAAAIATYVTTKKLAPAPAE